MKLTSAIVLGITLIGSMASARQFSLSQGKNYSVSPLYGYETVYRTSPRPHLATRAMYGLRITAGTDLLAGEAEYARASDTENFDTAPEKVYHEDETLKLGVRSTYNFGKYFFSSGRIGGQAARGFEENTDMSIATRKEKDLRVDPYAGLQIGIRLGVFYVNAGTSVVFKDYQNFEKNDFQHTLSFGVGN